MGLRGQRAPGRGRDSRGRGRVVALALALYLAAGVVATWPSARHLGSEFAAAGQAGNGGPSPGDHLQAVYNLWLLGDQLEHGRVPWRDHYSFQPEAPQRANFAAWPLGVPFWPLERLFGPVAAWNLLQLLLYAAAGGLSCWWLRVLGLPLGAALAGGLAFAIAPYRVSQSVEHLLGPISVLLPGALLALEKRRYLLAAAALASIPLSGQVHLALGAVPFFAAYALVRTRERRPLLWAGAAVAAALAAGLLVQRSSIEGSIAARGRSLDAVRAYSAGWLDLVSRSVRHGSERYAYLGWTVSLAALAGLVLLVRGRRFGLAAVLGLGAAVPVLLALGTSTPLYEPLWHALPPFRYPRVPERLLPVACLALAALAAFAVARMRWRWAPALAVAVLFLDLTGSLYHASAADEGNRAYAALRKAPPGRLLELPAFRPELHYGGVYLYYDLQARRQRPGGYSTVADPRADAVARLLQPLNCGDWTHGEAALLRRLGVGAVAVHAGLFAGNPVVPDTLAFALLGLAAHGFHVVATDGRVGVWLRDGGAPGRREVEPGPPVFCAGWGFSLPSGWAARERYAAFWAHGSAVTLDVSAPSPLVGRFSVDGRLRLLEAVAEPRRLRLELGRPGWHLVAVESEALAEELGKPVGIALRAVRAR
jgi:hypothetical protein